MCLTMARRALQVWQAVLTKPIDLDSPRIRQQMSDGARSLLKVPPVPPKFCSRCPRSPPTYAQGALGPPHILLNVPPVPPKFCSRCPLFPPTFAQRALQELLRAQPCVPANGARIVGCQSGPCWH